MPPTKSPTTPSPIEQAILQERKRILQIIHSDIGSTCYTTEPEWAGQHPVCNCWRAQIANAIEHPEAA